MSLSSRYGILKSQLAGYMDITIDETNPKFNGNQDGTCTAQVLQWFIAKANGPQKGEGLKEPLLSESDKTLTLHFDKLENGSDDVLKKIASEHVSLLGNNKAKALEKLTPWTGYYKMYNIANDKGDGHSLGAYFPYFGPIEFYDPNLVIGSIKTPAFNLYELLVKWLWLYDGTPEGASWGYANLFVIKDPAKALEKIGKI